MGTWQSFLENYTRHAELVRLEFMARWGGQPWEPTEEDRAAAGEFHVQLVSRISTQKLAYLDGSEKTALDSIYRLFGFARDICAKRWSARHFNAVVWEVLNFRVRPFTAKWHAQLVRGGLTALDDTDEFRADLDALQPLLACFADLLVELRDKRPAPVPVGSQPAVNPISVEMERPLCWGIPPLLGGLTDADALLLNTAEKAAIDARRVQCFPDQAQPTHAVGLALSGGGIRSATFSLGVLVALARRNILPQVDYLSTVSGGGYVGSFLSAFLGTTGSKDVGTRSDQLPFSRARGESDALRHIRHHSKYLGTGSSASKAMLVCAQVYGMFLNLLGLVVLVSAVAWLETFVRIQVVGTWFRGIWQIELTWTTVFGWAAAIFGGVLITAVISLRFSKRGQSADRWVSCAALLLAALVIWKLADLAHLRFDELLQTQVHMPWKEPMWLAILGVLPLVASAVSGLMRRLKARSETILGLIAGGGALAFLAAIYLSAYQAAARWGMMPTGIALAIFLLIYWCFFDVNMTSPHRHYRRKLAEAYLIRGTGNPLSKDIATKLSDLPAECAPYPLINCALNVPRSKDLRMQGRRTDFFLFSPKYCGSPLTGYRPTEEWQTLNQRLDLGTAMAISGAAAAPQMGTGTKDLFRFWLGVLNVRLGYWIRATGSSAKKYAGAPGLGHLLRELTGWMDECGPWLYLSDGGHIENLGVYELLRRRCKYIIAVDGEQDPKMTFHALTTLQRMALIDLGIKIDIDLDDLRLNNDGLSRSHFRFCRIHYPDADERSPVYGYLLYVKLSLTGNEGEFIRRYRLDEPVFPHHSTADQFFTEAQFEAYRALGEHIGDKLFLEAIIGTMAKSNNVDVAAWFAKLGEALLEPKFAPTS